MNSVVIDGKFLIEELDLKICLVYGTIREETLNRSTENSNLDEIVFHFTSEGRTEVPEKQLVLAGTFIIEGALCTRMRKAAFTANWNGRPDELFRMDICPLTLAL